MVNCQCSSKRNWKTCTHFWIAVELWTLIQLTIPYELRLSYIHVSCNIVWMWWSILHFKIQQCVFIPIGSRILEASWLLCIVKIGKHWSRECWYFLGKKVKISQCWFYSVSTMGMKEVIFNWKQLWFKNMQYINLPFLLSLVSWINWVSLEKKIKILQLRKHWNMKINNYLINLTHLSLE